MGAWRLDCVFALGDVHLSAEEVVIVDQTEVESGGAVAVGGFYSVEALDELAQISNRLHDIQEHLVLLILNQFLQNRILTVTIPPQYKRNPKEYNLIAQFQLLLPLQRLDNQFRDARLIQELLGRHNSRLILLPVGVIPLIDTNQPIRLRIALFNEPPQHPKEEYLEFIRQRIRLFCVDMHNRLYVLV